MTTGDITPGEQVRLKRTRDGAVHVWEGVLLDRWPTTDGEGVLLRTGSGEEYLAVSAAPHIATRMHRINEEES
jgi:hypothetical protein